MENYLRVIRKKNELKKETKNKGSGFLKGGKWQWKKEWNKGRRRGKENKKRREKRKDLLGFDWKNAKTFSWRASKWRFLKILCINKPFIKEKSIINETTFSVAFFFHLFQICSLWFVRSSSHIGFQFLFSFFIFLLFLFSLFCVETWFIRSSSIDECFSGYKRKGSPIKAFSINYHLSNSKWTKKSRKSNKKKELSSIRKKTEREEKQQNQRRHKPNQKIKRRSRKEKKGKRNEPQFN